MNEPPSVEMKRHDDKVVKKWDEHAIRKEWDESKINQPKRTIWIFPLEAGNFSITKDENYASDCYHSGDFQGVFSNCIFVRCDFPQEHQFTFQNCVFIDCVVRNDRGQMVNSVPDGDRGLPRLSPPLNKKVKL